MATIARVKTTDHRSRLFLAFKLIAMLLSLLIGLTVAVIYLLWSDPVPHRPATPILRTAEEWSAFVEQRYPTVNFQGIYPERSPQEIATIQRETFSLQYAYAPFVQFQARPVQRQHVNISKAGFRANGSPLAWPPDTNHLNIFIFGGSTTFGYGLPDDETLVHFLERALNRNPRSTLISCYNFGCGYYFSTQERLHLELLLQQNHVPDVAVFIDGLNEFSHADGAPQLTESLHNFVTPDSPYVSPHLVTNKASLELAINRVLDSYAGSLRIINALAQAFDFEALFIGQPVPFFEFGPTAEAYPFGDPPMHFLACAHGYPEFRRRADNGEFGNRFVWMGDTFVAANQPVYCEAVHYSAAGSRMLGERIANKIKHMLPIDE